MRNALVKRKLVILFIWFSISSICGQNSAYYNVPKIGQSTDSWCWAACMEMVMKFHDPSNSITQCKLAQAFMEIKMGSSIPAGQLEKCCVSLHACESCAATPTTTYFDRTIDLCVESSLTGRSSKVRPAHYFDLVFSLFGFNSVEALNWAESRITWEQITSQLDSCHPFIIIIDPLATSEIETDDPESGVVVGAPGTSHAIVAKGYYQSSTTNAKRIIVNDPWRPACDGSEYAVPANILFEGSVYIHPDEIDYVSNAVLAVVWNIYPKEDIYTSCNRLVTDHPGFDTPPAGGFESITGVEERAMRAVTLQNNLVLQQGNNDSPPLLTSLSQNADKIIGVSKDSITNKDLQALLNDANSEYYRTEVDYLNFNRMRKYCFFAINNRLSRFAYPNKNTVIEVVYTGTIPNIITTLQKVDSLWIVRGITNRTPMQKQISIKINGSGEEVILSNQKGRVAISNAIPYKLVLEPPLQYEIFAFEYRGKKYLAPADDYPVLGIYKHQAYSQNYIIGKLRKESKYYYKYKIGSATPPTRRLTIPTEGIINKEDALKNQKNK